MSCGFDNNTSVTTGHVGNWCFYPGRVRSNFYKSADSLIILVRYSYSIFICLDRNIF